MPPKANFGLFVVPLMEKGAFSVDTNQFNMKQTTVKIVQAR